MSASPQSAKADSAKSPHVFEAGQNNFENEVLQASLTTPVLVDFWATWCGPCRTLGPILEKLAAEYGGAFKLAKIDCDKEQQLAGMFGVRSIPTVVLIRDGQILDGFAGALPESQVREFLGKHNIQPAKKIETPAQKVADESAPAQRETPHAAIARLQKALAATPDDNGLKLDLALAQALGGTAASGELMARIENDPQDFAARDALGVRLLLGGDPAGAMEQFLAILKADRGWNEGLARKRLLDAFRIVEDEALVAAARRKMSSLLF
jgi:putative thioredoxin